MVRRLTVFVLVAVCVSASRHAGGADEKAPLVLEGHSAGIPAITFIGDGKTLATGSQDKTIKLWSIANKKEIATLEGHTAGVQSLAAAPDGKTLASADEGGLVKVWNLETRKELFTLKGQKGDAPGLTFSPDGKTLAVGGGGFDKPLEKAWGEIRLWEPATGKELKTITWPENRINAIAFSPDGTRLAACSSNGSVALWDVASGEKKSDLGKNPQGGTGLAFSPDGKTVACGNFFGTLTIKFWDAASGKETRTIETKGNVSAFSLKFLQDGKTLAVGGFDKDGVRDLDTRGAYVALWDVEASKERLLKGHVRGVIAVSVNRDGTRLAAGGLDTKARVWELPPANNK
jgi:WD40 repeat protein